MQKLILFILFLVPFSVFGQEAQPPISGMVGPLSVLQPGTYRGDIETRDGSGFHAFELVLKQNQNGVEGTSEFYVADSACRQQVPAVGTIQADSTVTLKAPGKVRGCDRTFVLFLENGLPVKGEVIGAKPGPGPKGEWKFKLTKM